MVQDGFLGVASLKAKVTHGDKGQRILLVDLKSLAQHICGVVKLFSIEVKNAQLRQCFEVVRLASQRLLEVRDRGIFVLRVLLQSLAQAEVCVDRI